MTFGVRGKVASLGMFCMAGALLVAGLASTSRGCGIDWSVPETHFDGVDARGHVCYSEKIGEVDFGGGLNLPLIINFRSDRESSSPYLGKGWILALLDSNFVQTGENAFQMVQPDGWVRPFYRGKPSDTTLNGGPNWKGEISGNTISVWVDCGWKFMYFKGKIAALENPKGRKLEFVYSGGKVTEIRENGAVKFAVDFDSAGGRSGSLEFNGKRLHIEESEKPRIQTIGGRNVVAGFDSSLHSLSGTDAADDRFEFAVNDTVEATLKISGKAGGERKVVWDPGTKLISKDGEWTYRIAAAKTPFENAAIERRNLVAQNEYWYLDRAKSQETTKGLDGSEVLREWFASGALALATRVEICKSNSKLLSKRRYIYDEHAKLIRDIFERIDQDVTVTNYWPNGNPKEIITELQNGGRLIRRIDENGILTSFSNNSREEISTVRNLTRKEQ